MNLLKKKYLFYPVLIIILFLNFRFISFGQIDFFLFYGANNNYYSADFSSSKPFTQAYPYKSNGNGSGNFLSVYITYPFYYKANSESEIMSKVSVGLSLDYLSQDGYLSHLDIVTLNFEGTTVDGQIEQKLDAKISSFGLAPSISFTFFDDLNFCAGLRFGFINQRSYEQKETLVNPPDRGYFIDTTGAKSRIRNKIDGILNNVYKPLLSLNLSVSYHFQLSYNDRISLIPQISYLPGLSNITKNGTWKINSLAFGLGLGFNF